MTTHKTPASLAPGERPVLVLQGGGALGAYQAGVYEELAEAGCRPDWLAGISIGAVNAALIAGNPPERRVERLREFWHMISSGLMAPPIHDGEYHRVLFNETSAALAATFGLPGFFRPRLPPAVFQPHGSSSALSVYDTAPLRDSLEKLIDFDRLNNGPVRLSVGAVNVRSGNFAYFDTSRQTIGPEHILASGALPPGFPPIEIDGEMYWDGGLVSNTPLQYVLSEVPQHDMLVFQVDLFSARGRAPRNLSEVAEREKDIRYSSRTRLNTDVLRREQQLGRAVHRLLEKLPDELRDDPDARMLAQNTCNAAVTIVHLIHRRKAYFTQSKDYEFSRHSVEEHWSAGRDDVRRSFAHHDWQSRQRPHDITVFDLTREAHG